MLQNSRYLFYTCSIEITDSDTDSVAMPRLREMINTTWHDIIDMEVIEVKKNIRKQILMSTHSLLQTNRHNKRQFDLDVVTSAS